MSRGTARGELLGRARPAVWTVVRAVVPIVLLLTGGACDKPAPAPSNDTVVVSPSLPQVADSVPATEESPWDSDAGPVFVVTGPNATTASVVVPTVAPDVEVNPSRLDVASVIGMRFDLLGNGRVVGSATVSAIVPVDAPEECTGWPLVQLGGVRDDSVARTWAVGLAAGRAAPIAFDSITGLSSADSSRLAIDIARLASSVPGDTVSELRGLPYQVRRAYRFPLAAGSEALVTEVWRTLNQEANPRQEHLVIIAERDRASGNRYDVTYMERAAGGEETLESSEVLAIARFAPTRDASILLARYVGDGVVYALLERVATRRWRLRWSSPYVGC
jgi:hypothetical protein